MRRLGLVAGMMNVLNWLTLVPTISAFIAFILSVLCLFSGAKTNFLTASDILTLYTPIGNETGVHDFYSIYVMSYCTGYLGYNGLGVNMTSCPGHDVLFSFEPEETLRGDSRNRTSLPEMGWPDAIGDDFQAFQIPKRSLGVFYCVGAGVTAIAILIRFGLLIARRGRQSIVEASSLMIAFVSLGIASIISTVIAFQFVHLINSHGRESGISATYGEQFLGMTWGAVGLLLVGSATSLVFVLVDHGRPEPGYVPPVEHDGQHEGSEGHEHKEVEGDSEPDRLSKA